MRSTVHVSLGVPPCYGQCWVHRASKNLDKRCGDKPKASGAQPNQVTTGEEPTTEEKR